MHYFAELGAIDPASGGLAGGLGGVGALVAAADGGVRVDGERARDARGAVGGVEGEQVCA